MQWIYLALCFVLLLEPGYTEYGDEYEPYDGGDYDYDYEDPCFGGITVTGFYGTVQTDGYPVGVYSKPSNCSWRIETESGTRIAVKFSPLFSVEGDPDNMCVDYLSITDADQTTEICGSQTPNSFLSSTNLLVVEFVANDEDEGRKGFSFNWTAIDSATISSPLSFDLNENEGTVSSPGFPSSYENLQTYSWTINVDESKYIVVEFDQRFGMEVGGNGGCPYDSITMYEGVADTVMSTRVLCAKPTEPILLKTSKSRIIFTTDVNVTDIGFSLNYRTVDPAECDSAHSVSGTSGTITSPYYSIIPYEDNLYCVWHITVSESQRIAVRFNEPFDIKFRSTCTSDHLRIFDGPTEFSQQFLEDFCGQNAPRGFLSSNNTLTVFFSTGTLDGTAAGFSLNWTAEDNCASGLFKCWDGACIDESLKCDGNIDCPNDIADEAECGSISLDSDCGIQENPPEFYWDYRIVGGAQAIQGSWPWQAGVLISGSIACGGVLISPYWVMTAAHCILKGPTITVVLGDHNITDFDDEREQRITVDQIFIHPNYNFGKSQGYLNGSDIALLHLSTPANRTTWVQPICLPSADASAEETVIATGWGRTSLTSFGRSEILRQVRLSTLDSTQCEKSFSTWSPSELPDGIICADGASAGMGICQGDSGGPGMALRNGKWEAVGIASFSYRCGVEGRPTYFTDVSSYMDYITLYTQQVSPEKERVTFVLNESSGSVSLLEVGDVKYLQNVLYRWFITVEENKRITVRFNDLFDIEFGEASCPFDHVIVYDGPTTASAKYLNKKLCGTLAPPDFESASNSIIVEFSSDGSYEYSGFSFQWLTTDDCTEREFRCWDRTCIALDLKCDGKWDCVDGADEIQCQLPAVSQCGVPEVEPTIPWYPLIVGGHNAGDASWPWQVALYENPDTFSCGATLIDSRWILTAAQCIDSTKTYTVVLGDYDLDYISQNERSVEVDRATIYPTYVRPGENDIAMLYLKTEASFSKWIKPICLPEATADTPVVGSTCILTGWGSTASASSEYSRILQQATLTVFSESDCLEAYKEIDPLSKSLPNNLMCAGHAAKRVGSCQKDFGGPLQCLVDGAWLQFGILSLVRSCGDYMFFEKVSYYKVWIEEGITRRACDARQVLEGTSGVVESVLINGIYLTNLNCSWLIRAPEGKQIVMNFERFDIEQHPVCEYDNLTLYDGNNEKARMILDEPLCGLNRTFPKLVSTGNEVLIVFKSDASKSYTGFKISYTTIDSCGENEFQCWDLSCIDESKHCDGVIDCPGERDEIECPHPTGFCGIQYVAPSFLWDARIYGGSYAEKGSWPWQVYIVGAGSFQCGASVVNEDWVLTAAHCTYFTLLYVGIGGHNLTDDANDQLIRVNVADIHRHENYKRGNIQFGYDIALLRLRTKITFGTYVQPVCLATASNDPISPTAECFVTGWGLTRFRGDTSEVLRQVHVPILTDAQCGKAHGQPYYGSRIFCAGDYDTGGIDACSGDSGGPLVCFDNGHWYQYGIVSYGIEGCGLPGKPGYYTTVSVYERWIQNVTNGSLPLIPPPITEVISTTVRDNATKSVDTTSGFTRQETKSVDTTSGFTRQETENVDTTSGFTRQETKSVDTTSGSTRRETSTIYTSIVSSTTSGASTHAKISSSLLLYVAFLLHSLRLNSLF